MWENLLSNCILTYSTLSAMCLTFIISLQSGTEWSYLKQFISTILFNVRCFMMELYVFVYILNCYKLYSTFLLVLGLQKRYFKFENLKYKTFFTAFFLCKLVIILSVKLLLWQLLSKLKAAVLKLFYQTTKILIKML